ncbi:MAG: fumarylacetoacetate hydrolase family protein [Rhodothermales bacterium]
MNIVLPGTDIAVVSPRIFCIGRNYAKHAAEMNSAVPTTPMVFLKPSTALVRNGGLVRLPAASSNVHHEVELVVVIGKQGRDIAEADTLSYVGGYGIGLDMTARDIQAEAKKKGHPWSVAKGFDSFAPLGDLVPADAVEKPQLLEITLKVNDEIRQAGETGDMIFSVSRLIAYCSTVFTLLPGDLIYTGTPEGVAQVVSGDKMEATITGLPTLRVSVL